MRRLCIAVWFSRGAASAVAAKLAVAKWGREHEVRVLTSPVKEEDPDNLRFEADVQRWIGAPIEYVLHPDYPGASAVDVWDKVKGMSFPKGAPCTRLLKREARQKWEVNNPADYHVFGFTVEEEKRHRRFVLTERSNVIPLLIHYKITKQMCYNILVSAGIEPPRVYAEGYPNANCIGCVKATSPTYWNLVRRTRPEVFAERAEQSRRLGARLVRYKGARIFLDELPEDATGRPLETMQIECGIFCEEPEK